MRLQTISGLAAIAILSSAALLPGQTVESSNVADSPTVSVSTRNLTPGTIAPMSAPKVSIAYIAEQRTPVNRVWVASLVAVAAASGLDAATSWGKYEGNSMLASSDGRFGAKGLTIKAGLGAAALIPQIFFMRNHKQLRSRLAITNFAEAAVFGGIAVHNLGIQAPGR